MSHALPIGTALGRLQFHEVYDVYDGPRLFSAVSATGSLYLSFWIREHAAADDWLYVAVSPTKLDEVVEGVVPLRHAYTHSEDGILFLVTTPFDGSPSTATPTSARDIDEALLPDPEDVLSGRRTRPADQQAAVDEPARSALSGQVRDRRGREAAEPTPRSHPRRRRRRGAR